MKLRLFKSKRTAKANASMKKKHGYKTSVRKVKGGYKVTASMKWG